MRVLLASYFYPPSIGGVEQHTWLLAHGLAARGHMVRVVTSGTDSISTQEAAEGIVVQRVHAGIGGPYRRMLTYLSGVSRYVLKYHAWSDVIHVQQLLYPAAAIGALRPLLRRPMVVANHGSGYISNVREMQSKPFGNQCLWLVARSAVVVSLNDEMSAEMSRAGFTRIVKIPNGVPIPDQRTPGRYAQARGKLGVSGNVALFMGRLTSQKGVDILAKAWSRMNTTGATLLIVGEGVSRADVERNLCGPSRARVQFHPLTRDVRLYLDAADVYVLPSRGEGLSYGLLEAMAHGLPIVATDIEGNRQVIDTSDTGVLVPSEDPIALGEALEALLGDATLRAQLGECARAHIQQHYSVESMLDSYERLYMDLLPH